jgi:hypothetical protein
MKKYLITAMFIAGLSAARAQQVPTIIAPNMLSLDALKQKKPFPVDSVKSTPQASEITALSAKPGEIVVYSRMPVKKIQGLNSKTPVTVSGSGMAYKMPVKKVRIINPDSVAVKVNP